MKTALLKNIESKMTGKYYHLPDLLASVTYTEKKIDDSIHIGKGREVRVDVNIGSAVIIDEELINSDYTNVMQMTKGRIGRGIAEEVYGEIRRGLIDLSITLQREGRYNGNSLEQIENMLDMISYP